VTLGANATLLTPTATPHASEPRPNARRWFLVRGALAIGVLAALAATVPWRASAPADPERIWREAEANLQAGRWNETQAGIARLEALRPPTTNDWLLRAQLASALDRDLEALEALRHVPEDHTLAPQAAYMAGRIEHRRNRMRFAETAYRKALALDANLVKARRELVYIFGMQLRRAEIDSEFKVLSRLTHLDHHDLFTWGLTHFTVWGPDIAGDLEAFIAADPLDRHSRLALAMLLFDEPAFEHRVEQILEPLPASDPEATALRIEMRLNHARFDEALALLRDAPEDHPRLARLHGRAALLRGDVDAAIRHFRQALSREPYDRVSLAELGKALLLKGEKTAAAECLTRVKRLDDVYNLVNRVSKPDKESQAPDLGRLARACEAAGLLDEARGWFALAIARDPLDAEAQKALHRLRDAVSP
jgi:tetratricopeptide (TPR) repeat protein